ncbi:MAG: tetratricopeptide repeat protein [Candidatus Cloacimonetes bacterium]|nr:tetratricopeptide repeat protein [Candidatus Cloacimonadota bacterium]
MKQARIVSVFLALIIFVQIAATEVEDVGYIAYLYRLGETRTALLKIDDFLRQYPDSRLTPDVLFLRAGIDLMSGRFERARDTYADLLRRHDDPAMRAEVLLGLAQAHYFLGETEAAESRLRQFVRNDPAHPLNIRAWYFLGKLAQDADDHETALEHFEIAARFGADGALIVARVASLAQLGRYDAAERAITGLFDQDETRRGEEALLLYHDINQRRGRAERVLGFELDRVPPASPFFDDYMLLLGQANFEMGRYDEALRRLDSISAANGQAAYLRGLCLLALDRTEQASVIFRSLYEESEDEAIAVNSFFYMARLTARSDPATGNGMLEGFLAQHTGHSLAGAAAYQLGMNHYDAEESGLAAQRFEQALSLELEPVNREKARFLLAESHFLAGSQQQAEIAFQDYLELHPLGRFADEALFKQGVLAFETKRYDRATERFGRLLDEHADSPKAGMAEFYLGEISFFDGRYTFALQHYYRALDGETDIGYTQERIARIHFQNKDYQSAIQAVSSIPVSPRYSFDKFLLTGDIYFAMKEYAQALNAYEQAENISESAERREVVRSRLAWAYYQQGQYDRAAQIYSELTTSSSTPETFLMLAAQAAFSADDYLSAIQSYRQYVQTYSQSSGYEQALLGMADSYYNLGSYEKAVDYYRPLIRPQTKPDILDNALNGLVWSARQSDAIDLPGEIDRLLAQAGSGSLAPSLLLRKAVWMLAQKRYDESVTVCNRITRDYPEFERSAQVYNLLAQCYRAQGKLGLAESVYAQMDQRAGGTNVDVLFDWAQVKLAAADTLGAIEKLETAADLSRQSRVWLKLLQTQLAVGDEDFIERYQAFSRFATEREMAEAQLLWVDWQVRRQQLGLVDAVLTTLLQSQWKDVRARAQYWTGRVLFERGRYEEAVAELLRVRYLFPESAGAQLVAEFYACLAWIELGEPDKARERLETIRPGLSPMQVRTLEHKLGGE